MKAAVYDMKGNSVETIELPAVFGQAVREDIVSKYVESDRVWQPYAINPEAGKHHSASGTISHKRHDWKGQYGKGISRTPRKAMWRRGSQFYWVGAEVSNTRGGRRPHGPKGVMPNKKINKKEQMLAFASAFAATAHPEFVSKRYATFAEKKLAVPFIVTLDKAVKAKQLRALVEKLLHTSGSHFFVHSVRGGRGGMRGRAHKKPAGVLMVIGDTETVRSTDVEVRKASEVRIADLYPLGRIVMYTKNGMQEVASWF